MINKDQLYELAEKFCEQSDIFVVEVNISASNDIEVIVDSTGRVCMNQCATLSKNIQEELDAKGYDYSIIVASAGIGSNLRDFRQIAKTVGRSISVVLNDGIKIIGELKAFDVSNGVITIEYEEKVSVEGKKRKDLVKTTKDLAFADTKSIIEELKIK